MFAFKIFKILLLSLLIVTTSGCQLNYLLKSGYNQMKILNDRVPLEKALKDPNLTDEEKRKLQLAVEVRDFANSKLHLTVNKTYTAYTKLNRPYVSWVLSAAPKWELKAHTWSYPIVGDLPYRGFYSEEEALEEQASMQENYDTYVRGVSAYSTLGWFKDPILSSMLRYEDTIFVNTLIHELVHATVFIKNNADFNERLAVFLGGKGMELFYQQKQGSHSTVIADVAKENADDLIFSEFIASEIEQLKKWYETLPSEQKTEENRQKQFTDIKNRFSKNILPKMKAGNWQKFPEVKLNNARLMTYGTYMTDLSDFEKLYNQESQDFLRFIDKIRTLEKSKEPDKGLKDLITK